MKEEFDVEKEVDSDEKYNKLLEVIHDHNNELFKIDDYIDFDQTVIIEKKFNIPGVDVRVERADIYTISDDGIFFLGEGPLENGVAKVEMRPTKKETDPQLPKKYERITPSPFIVRNVINVHVADENNIIYPATHKNSSITKRLVIQTKSGDIMREAEWPCEVFTNQTLASTILRPMVKDNYNITLTQNTLPHLNNVLNKMVATYQSKNPDLPALFEGSGWMFTPDGKMVSYTQNGLENNVSKSLWFGVKGEETMLKKAWRHLLTNTLLDADVPVIRADNKHIINEVFIFTACWALASMIRVPGLANYTSSQIVNMQGPGGSGKSTAALLAMSLFGNAKSSIFNPKSTFKGLDSIRAQHNHAPFFRDELTNITEGSESNKRLQGEQFKQAIFDLTELHQKRAKMQLEGNEHTVKSTRSVALNNLTTSNSKIMERIKELNNDQDGAISARVVEILVVKNIDKNSPDAKYATTILKFEGTDSASADAIRQSFLKEIESMMENNHGHAIPYFEKYIKENFDELKQALENSTVYYNQFNQEQNRQNNVYAMVDTMCKPFLTWLGFDMEEMKHIYAQLRSFIQFKVLPYNVMFATGNLMSMTTQQAVEIIERIAIPRKENWYIKGAGNKRAYIMGNDVDLLAINQEFGKSYTEWSKEAQRDFVMLQNSRKAQSNSHAHFTVSCSKEMTSVYQFEEIGISRETGLFQTGSLHHLKSEINDIKLNEIVALATREGWIVADADRNYRTIDALGKKGFYTFNLVKAREIIAEQIKDAENEE